MPSRSKAGTGCSVNWSSNGSSALIPLIAAWIAGSVGPGASPTPTIPSSVATSTTRPEADSRIPPDHFSGSTSGTRTAVVFTLVTRKNCRLGRSPRIVNHRRIVNNPHTLEPSEPRARARDRGAARGDHARQARRRRAPDRGPDRAAARDEPGPGARGAPPARARRSRRLVPVSRGDGARRLGRRGAARADPDPADARTVLLPEGARAHDRRRLRRAREGGLADGRGCALRRPDGGGRGRHPLPRDRALALGPAAQRAALGCDRAAHPGVLLPLRAGLGSHADRARAQRAALGHADSHDRGLDAGPRAAHRRPGA